MCEERVTGGGVGVLEFDAVDFAVAKEEQVRWLTSRNALAGCHEISKLVLEYSKYSPGAADRPSQTTISGFFRECQCTRTRSDRPSMSSR